MLEACKELENRLYQTLSSYDHLKDRILVSTLQSHIILLLFDILNSNTNFDVISNAYFKILQIFKQHSICVAEITTLETAIKAQPEQFQASANTCISNLKKLLISYIYWCTLEIQKNANYTIYQVTVSSGLLSKIINNITAANTRELKENDEIRIFASNTIYIDTDLKHKFSGVNIIIIAPNIELVNNKHKFHIITSGKNGINHHQPIMQTTKKITNTAKNKAPNGAPGKDGQNGTPGHHAGNILVLANKLPPIAAIALGGNGSDGENGGNGMPGEDGGDGYDPAISDESLKQLVLNTFKNQNLEQSMAQSNIKCARYILLGSNGIAGGDGGAAGSAGYGGAAGNGGTVVINTFEPNPLKTAEIRNFVGTKGKDGMPGNPGQPGKHGRDGLDYVVILEQANYSLFSYPSFKIQKGRIKADEPDVAQDKQQRIDGCKFFTEQSLSMPIFEALALHPRFKDKYFDDKTATIGNNNFKPPKIQIIPSIHAIDIAAILKLFIANFEPYINNSSELFQHWLVAILKPFLEHINAFGLPQLTTSSCSTSPPAPPLPSLASSPLAASTQAAPILPLHTAKKITQNKVSKRLPASTTSSHQDFQAELQAKLKKIMLADT